MHYCAMQTKLSIQLLINAAFLESFGFKIILIKSNHNPYHSLLLHEQHYTYNLNTKTRWNQKLLNIEFDQEFKNYNFIIEQILKFKMLSQFICTNACIRPVVPTIWTTKYLQFKKWWIQKLLTILKSSTSLYNIL